MHETICISIQVQQYTAATSFGTWKGRFGTDGGDGERRGGEDLLHCIQGILFFCISDCVKPIDKGAYEIPFKLVVRHDVDQRR